MLVPSTAPGFLQLEMIVLLVDVPEELGPTHLVSRKHTPDRPAVPNWLPAAGNSSETSTTSMKGT